MDDNEANWGRVCPSYPHPVKIFFPHPFLLEVQVGLENQISIRIFLILANSNQFLLGPQSDSQPNPKPALFI